MKSFVLEITIAFYFSVSLPAANLAKYIVLIYHETTNTTEDTRSFAILKKEERTENIKNISMLINSLFVAVLFFTTPTSKEWNPYHFSLAPNSPDVSQSYFYPSRLSSLFHMIFYVINDISFSLTVGLHQIEGLLLLEKEKNFKSYFELFQSIWIEKVKIFEL